MQLIDDADIDAGLIARRLIETAPTLLYIYDLVTGRNVYISPQCRDLIGYTAAEIAEMERLATTLFHPDDVPRIKTHHARIMSSAADDRTIHDIEYRMHHRDGSWRWFASRETVHRRNADGRPTQLLGAALDVTERIEREAILRQSADTFSLLVRENPFGIYIVDEAFRIVEISQGARKTFASAQPVIGRDFAEVLHILWPDPFASETIARFRHTLATGEPHVATGTVETRRDIDEVESYDWRISRITLPDGRPGVVCHFYDLSERQSYEAALEQSTRRLRDSEQRLRLAQDYAGIGSWAWDHQADNSEVSESYRRLHGFAPGEKINRERLLGAMHAEDREPFMAAVRQALVTGRRMEVEYRVTLADGAVRWLRGVGQAVMESDASSHTSTGTVEDITARKEAEARLQHANAELEERVQARTAELEQANAALREEIVARERVQAALVQSQKLEALGQLTSGIAHDFNNVIAAISGGFSIIQRRSDDPRILEIAQHGVAAAERGGKLVRQLTAFARQETLKPRALRLADLLAQTEPLLRRSAAEAELLLDCPDAMPNVRIDPTFLETALLNLVINARDALGGTGKIGLAVATSRAGDKGHHPEMAGPAVRIDVTDNGCGMPPEVLAHALDPFFTTKGPGKGTGLGLAMVHGFVRQSGGAMAISSVEGRGTRVTLFLPQVEESEPDAGPVDAAGAPPLPDGPALRIVLAEDDPQVRMMVATMLRDRGHAVREAEDADAAEALLRAAPAQLLMTDVRMPGRDGTALAEAVRRAWPDLPILFMTGHADRARLDGEHVLDKPFSPEALCEAIARIQEGGVVTSGQFSMVT